jgi:hypothetical protein
MTRARKKLHKVINRDSFTAMNTQDFKEWMDERGLKAADVAREMRVDEATVRNWRSGGVPARRLPHVQAFMASWVDPSTVAPVKSLQDYFPPGSMIHLTPDQDQFDRWTAAFKKSSEPTFREWAEHGLDRIADEVLGSEGNANGTSG